jgi:CRISPR-associated protein Cmr6
MRYPIPKDSAAAWEAQRNRSPLNPGLVFERYAPDWGSSTDKEAKRHAIQEVVGIANKQADRRLLTAWNERWEASVQRAGGSGFSLSTDWRFVPGLGRKGPLEAGFTFHRYGFPILPGSSVKGIARAFGLGQVAEALAASDLNKLDELLSLDKEEKYTQRLAQEYPAASQKALQTAANFRAIFGSPVGAGRAVFFDAIPAPGRLPRLCVDLMNPHYPDYYQGGQYPTNWQSPRPVFFLAVDEGVEFRFAVGWRGQADSARRDQAEDWLRGGLAMLGAGAKTSAGYGAFSERKKSPGEAGREAEAAKAVIVPPGYKRGRVREFGLPGRESYGFINPEGGGREVFVHRNNLAGGLTTLQPGQVVIFKMVAGPKGPKAEDVRPG